MSHNDFSAVETKDGMQTASTFIIRVVDKSSKVDGKYFMCVSTILSPVNVSCNDKHVKLDAKHVCIHIHTLTHTHTHIIIKVKWANSWAFWILPYWKMSVAKAIECRQTRFSMKMRALAFGANNHSDNKYHDNDNLHSYHFCHFHQCSLLSFIPAWQIILIHGKLS